MNKIYAKSLLAAYFSASFMVSFYWYQSGYFSVLDIFFDADPITNLASIAHAWGRHVVTHAFLELFSIPIRAIEYIFSSVDLVSDNKSFREVIALAISPIFSTLNIVIFYLLLKKLNLNNYDSVILTLIFAFSFSNLVFSFIPETYAISGFLICTTIYYFNVCNQNPNNSKSYIWLALGILLCGITITNVVVFSIIFFFYLRKVEDNSIINAISITLVHTLLSIFTVIILYSLSDMFLKIQFDDMAGLSYLSDFFIETKQQLFINMVNFANISIHSIIGILPMATESKYNSTFASNSLSLIRTDNFLIWFSYPLIIISIIVFSIFKNTENKFKNTYVICILIIAFNFMLHSLFGRELFLYSQHWLAPMCILLIPTLKNKRILSTSIFLLVAITNISIILCFDELISATPS